MEGSSGLSWQQRSLSPTAIGRFLAPGRIANLVSFESDIITVISTASSFIWSLTGGDSAQP
jgi:hypothetical protein